MAQPPIRLGSGAGLNGVGKGSLVIPLTKCGVAFAASTPAMKHKAMVDVMAFPFPGSGGRGCRR